MFSELISEFFKFEDSDYEEDSSLPNEKYFGTNNKVQRKRGPKSEIKNKPRTKKSKIYEK